jgi:dienelactone hydrolase
MATETDVRVPVGQTELAASLALPTTARGVVLFAHGSGSSRHSPRNRTVARHLNHAGYATVLLDLLTADEDAEDRLTQRHRFDIRLLAERLTAAIDWAGDEAQLGRLPLGLFGASTGAAAALIAAAARTAQVGAVVSRGGRPDLAGGALNVVQAPTLLLVGENDRQVLELHHRILPALGPIAALVVIPGATHLFEEPGAMEQVMERATAWFDTHLDPGGPVLDGLPDGEL